MNQPTEERILELARQEAGNIAAPGLPGAEDHNTKTIAHAIDIGVQEERRAWGEWKKSQSNGTA